MRSETPDRLIAGVEVGGVHISDDQGETWTERERSDRPIAWVKSFSKPDRNR